MYCMCWARSNEGQERRAPAAGDEMTRSKRHPPLMARLTRHAGLLKRARGFSRLVAAAWPRETGATYEFEVDFYGLRYRGNLGSHIDREVYFFGAYEADELALVRRWWGGRAGGVALDVGANVGHHTLAFSRIFGSVHAFEPNPMVFGQLERAVYYNRVDNVTLHSCGLWDCDAVLEFNVPPAGNTGMGSFKEEIPGMGDAAKVVLPVRRGDDVLASAKVERIDFVKIDVQGAEGEALNGLARTLAQSRPLVWIEISPTTRETLPTLANLLRKLGGGRYEALHLTRAHPLLNVVTVRTVDEAAYATMDGNLFLLPTEA